MTIFTPYVPDHTCHTSYLKYLHILPAMIIMRHGELRLVDYDHTLLGCGNATSPKKKQRRPRLDEAFRWRS